MAKNNKKAVLTPLILGAFAVILAGCTQTRDVIETVTPAGWFSSEQQAAEKLDDTDQNFPELAKMQQSPVSGNVKREHEILTQQLIADREKANYSAQNIQKMVSTSDIGNDIAPAGSLADENSTLPDLADDEGAAARRAAGMAEPALTDPPEAAQSLLDIDLETPVSPANNEPSLLTNYDVGGLRRLPLTEEQEASQGRLLANIIFPRNVTKLQPGDENVLAEIVRFFDQYEVKKLYIVGHSSPSDSKGFTSGMLANYKYSLDRATKVGERLVALGIPTSAIQIDARGGNTPLYSEATTNGVIGNRRVEIFVEF